MQIARIFWLSRLEERRTYGVGPGCGAAGFYDRIMFHKLFISGRWSVLPWSVTVSCCSTDCSVAAVTSLPAASALACSTWHGRRRSASASNSLQHRR